MSAQVGRALAALVVVARGKAEVDACWRVALAGVEVGAVELDFGWRVWDLIRY